MKRLASLLILASLSAYAQRPELEGRHFDITYNHNHFDGKISQGLGVGLLDMDYGVSFENTLVVHIWVTNFQHYPIVMDVSCFLLGDGESNIYEPDYNVDRVMASNLFHHHLNPMESLDGYIYFIIPPHPDKLVLVYHPGVGEPKLGGLRLLP